MQALTRDHPDHHLINNALARVEFVMDQLGDPAQLSRHGRRAFAVLFALTEPIDAILGGEQGPQSLDLALQWCHEALEGLEPWLFRGDAQEIAIFHLLWARHWQLELLSLQQPWIIDSWLRRANLQTERACFTLELDLRLRTRRAI